MHHLIQGLSAVRTEHVVALFASGDDKGVGPRILITSCHVYQYFPQIHPSLI
jgi:hypothetical protein